MSRQLFETLVVAVDGREERHRVGGVHEHRQAEHARGRKRVGETGIVGQDKVPADVAYSEPEVLPHFEAACSSPRGIVELPVERRLRLAGQYRPIEMAERQETSGMGAVVTIEI